MSCYLIRIHIIFTVDMWVLVLTLSCIIWLLDIIIIGQTSVDTELLMLSEVALGEIGLWISTGSCITDGSTTVSISGLCKLAGPLLYKVSFQFFWNSMYNHSCKIWIGFSTFIILQVFFQETHWLCSSKYMWIDSLELPSQTRVITVQ